MNIVEYYALDEIRRARYREQIGKGDWKAARFLCGLLEKDELRKRCGPGTRLLLGLEGDRLAAFCTLAEQDEVDAPDMTPWIGFVYTFPEYRGRRRSGELIERACEIALDRGAKQVYVSTDEIGLYEKYGFAFVETMKDTWGGDTRVYRRQL